MASLDVKVRELSDPTLLSNSEATKAGRKVYSHGTTYNGGIAPTISGTSLTAIKGDFIPYQMQDGSWRCKLNIEITQSTATSKVLTIVGITWQNISPHAGFALASDPQTTASVRASADSNASTITWANGTTTTSFSISGDVPLASKPTWAY